MSQFTQSASHHSQDSFESSAPLFSSARRWLVAAAMLAVVAGGVVGYNAAAAEPETQALPEIVNRPLNRGVRGQITREMPLGESHTFAIPDGDSSQTFMQIEDGRRVEVRIENGKIVKVEVNGESVPKERARREGSALTVVDADGKTIATFDVDPPAPPAPPTVRGFGWSPPGQAPAVTMPSNPPPVMLGITMDDAEEGDEGVTIASVLEGLPAGNAGIRVGDRVVKMDGTTIKGPKEFRETLKSKKAGETLKVTVVRGDENVELDVKLEAYDPKRLQMGSATAWNLLNEDRLAMGQRDSEWYNRAIESIAKAMEEIKQSDALNGPKFKESATAALEQAKASLEQARARMEGEMARLLADGQGMRLWSVPRRQMLTIPAPAPVPPAMPGASDDQRRAAEEQVASHMDRLTTMMERLDRRLEKLEKRLEEREKNNR